MKKKIYIKTFGCQMNEYDSNRIYDSLKNINFEKTDIQSDADCYVLNTCHIRDKAKEKVYHEVGRVRKIFRNKKKPIVIIAGCVAQAENEEMFKREPYIDIVIGPQAYHKIYNIDFKHLDILKEIPYGEYDVIISNPPYIGQHELNNLMSDVKDFEPLIALTDNKDGLSFYSRISSIAPMLLRKNGFVILEVGLGEHPNQAYEIFKKNGYKNINLIKDFNNDKRVLKANI